MTGGRSVSPEGHERPAWGPLIGTLVFVSVVPASAVLLVPYLLSGWEVQPALLGLHVFRWLGLALGLTGSAFFVDFCRRFVVEGRGTPAPIAPTEHLVLGGPFSRVRNPGYLSVLAMVVGQGLLFGRPILLAYAVGLAVTFHTFVVCYEEPTLRRRFGAQYAAYCDAVPRWVPRWRTHRARH